MLGAPGSVLETLGRVGGLGKGERIYAVRFVGDKGYVVTFRQVDPLYTLDLSDKDDPKVLGELKILGYSAYLHPVSDDLLLGVGQDATEQGRRLGTQLSLFDVSDLRRPVRRAQASLGANSSTSAEFDPHAFLFWKPANLAVIPLSDYLSARATSGLRGRGRLPRRLRRASPRPGASRTRRSPASPTTGRRSRARSSSTTSSTRSPARGSA